MTGQALQRLLEGNRRFTENKPALDGSEKRRREIALEQHPFAIILGCVDLRVPPELIFDQGLGELLVIRTAGEVLDRAVLGSIEFGVGGLKIPLLVVLGHKDCAAIAAAREMLHGHGKAEADIQYLVKELTLAVKIGDEADKSAGSGRPRASLSCGGTTEAGAHPENSSRARRVENCRCLLRS